MSHCQDFWTGQDDECYQPRVDSVDLVRQRYNCSCLEFRAGESWIVEANLLDEHHIHQYLTSLYFSLTALTSVGYGDISAKSTKEKVFVIYMLVVGALVYACIFGFVTNTVQNIMKNAETFRERLESIETFSVLHQLPEQMEERMTGYIHYLWHHTKVEEMEDG